ncbi:MAG: FliA/WhiG family RNA polymerase sigma factor [Verrucomicrobiota bacterium]|jgi:RNA polymerase sigma factor FliA|nr:FliA/WhiG family RNA polymerase sigma factor [Verrucomicrobiota bacterium]
MNAECTVADTATLEAVHTAPLLRKAWASYSSQDQGGESENALVKEYLPLVRGVVGRLAMSLPAHVHQEELYSPGLLGLLNAIRNFDPSQKASFEGYAKHRIRGAVLDELRRMDWVPRSIHEKAKKVERAITELESVLQRMPEEDEVAAALQISLKDYRKLMETIRPATFVSIHDCNDGSGSEGGFVGVHLEDADTPGPDEVTSRQELAEKIKEKINELPDRMKKVLAFYYYENMRLKEIAAILGVTESRVCQIHSEAILLIRGLARDL